LIDTDFVILGGGWAGLLYAHELKSKFPDKSVTVLERSSKGSLGGLLRSEEIGGFVFDVGGPHILFSKNKETLNKIVSLLQDDVRKIERKAFVDYKGTLVPYPFENGLYVLPPEERVSLGIDLIKALVNLEHDPEWEPKNFREWIYGIFGNAIGESYLEPYNKKIWKTSPEEMCADWVFTPGRLPLPSLKDIISSIAGIESVGYKEQAFFYYPGTGGINKLYDRLLEESIKIGVTVIADFNVSDLKKEGTKWIVNNQVSAGEVVNTLPLTVIPDIMQVPKTIEIEAKKLNYNRDVVVGVAINKPGPDWHVLYVPRSDIIFHRVTFMSNLMKNHNILQSNLIAETTVNKKDETNIVKITNDTISGLMELGIIDSDRDIIFTKTWVNEYGYPIYDFNNNEARYKILSFLKQNSINSVGRWGSWHYWNTDKVYEAVVRSVSTLDFNS
jgi:protoporphyrinogen oxidase